MLFLSPHSRVKKDRGKPCQKKDTPHVEPGKGRRQLKNLDLCHWAMWQVHGISWLFVQGHEEKPHSAKRPEGAPHSAIMCGHRFCIVTVPEIVSCCSQIRWKWILTQHGLLFVGWPPFYFWELLFHQIIRAWCLELVFNWFVLDEIGPLWGHKATILCAELACSNIWQLQMLLKVSK